MKNLDWNKAAYAVDDLKQSFKIKNIDEHYLEVIVFDRPVLCSKPLAWADIYDAQGNLLRPRLKPH